MTTYAELYTCDKFDIFTQPYNPHTRALKRFFYQFEDLSPEKAQEYARLYNLVFSTAQKGTFKIVHVSI